MEGVDDVFIYTELGREICFRKFLQVVVIGNDNDGIAATGTGTVWLTPGYLRRVFLV